MSEIQNVELVSIIIPCYNAEQFLAQTLHSVFAQSFQNFEIIIVNDGSTDNSENIIHNIQDSRIIYIKKSNTGVSDSRNIGFQKSKGDYILFLDSDDILASDFIEKRVGLLSQHQNIGFCSSLVIRLDENRNKIAGKLLRGVASDILQEILSYDSEIVTSPSNYLFRKSVLTKYSVSFRTDLSSSADRFFLVELSNYTKGGIIFSGGVLYYRVHASSMSNNLTMNLINDNLLFQKKVLKLNFIPKKLRKEFCFKTNYILAGCSFKLKKIPYFIWYALNSFYYSPTGFLKKIIQ